MPMASFSAATGCSPGARTQRECYLNSLRTIEQMGEFILDHQQRSGRPLFGGAAIGQPAADRDAVATAILPFLRGVVSSSRRVVGHVNTSDEALTFANSKWADDLCQMGTSCPDHFLRTRISPMFVAWDPERENLDTLKHASRERVEQYRRDYAGYYSTFADAASPAQRGSDPSVVVIPGIGLFGFAKDKKEARITAEFFVNAIQVMAGANALEDAGERRAPTFWQARHPEQRAGFKSFHNYVALPRGEAFRIEYWALEEAKLQRMPPEKEFSRKIALVVGAGSGIGRDVAAEAGAEGRACRGGGSESGERGGGGEGGGGALERRDDVRVRARI